METSIYLAKAWGLLLCIVFFSMFFNKTIIETIKQEAAHISFVIMTGYFALIIGILSVLSHNIWTGDWRVVVTLIGWTSLIKGIVRLMFPAFSSKFIQTFSTTSLRILIVFSFAIGLYLLGKGFIFF